MGYSKIFLRTTFEVFRATAFSSIPTRTPGPRPMGRNIFINGIEFAKS